MYPPPGTAQYHLLVFERSEEAAAFVAALSRFLNSPQGSPYRLSSAAVEVWGHAATTPDRLEIYLSDCVLAAATAAFAPVPLAATQHTATLPPDSARILSVSQIPAWGLTDAQRYLTQQLGERL